MSKQNELIQRERRAELPTELRSSIPSNMILGEPGSDEWVRQLTMVLVDRATQICEWVAQQWESANPQHDQGSFRLKSRLVQHDTQNQWTMEVVCAERHCNRRNPA